MINILIVDDSGVIRSSLKSILEERNYNVYEAASLNDLKYNSFSNEVKLIEMNLILLDFYLQNETGLEVIDFLNSKQLSIPIVMMTGEGKRDIVIKAIKMGAKDYLLKPFDKDILIKKVDSILNIKNLKMDKKGYLNEVKEFKKNLLLEIERSIRAKLELCIGKMILPQNEILAKDIIKKEIRDIDQVYLVSKMTSVFIFPLTDENGFDVIKAKIEKSLAMDLDGEILNSKHFIFKGQEKTINQIEEKNEMSKAICIALDLGQDFLA